MKRRRLNELQADAEQHYSNYEDDGYDEYYDDYDEDEYEDEYEDDYDDEYEDEYEDDYDDDEFYEDEYEDDYAPVDMLSGAFDTDYMDFAAAKGQINPIIANTDRTLTFNINFDGSMPGTDAREVTLFGAFAPSANLGVNISLQESNYAAFLEETKSQPSVIGNLLYEVTNKLQFSNSFEIKTSSATGRQTSFKVQPNNYRNPQNNIETLIRLNDFLMPVDGRNGLTFLVNPGEQVTLTFKVMARTQLTNILRSKNAVEVGKKSRPIRSCPKRKFKRRRRKMMRRKKKKASNFYY